MGSGEGGGGGWPDEDEQIRRRLEAVADAAYPRAARRARAQGVAKVRFCVDGEGQPRETAIVGSTGFELLDEAALSVVARAAPFPKRMRCVVVPVRFKILP
ncbi:MAG: TonB family protein [Deltaproteobacteria bacterium]|nr:TonB family protein [Deltaproteobacteria bacterium]